MMPVQQMNVTLSPEMARFIRAKVASGEYTNISEVVRDAVRRMQETDAARGTVSWLQEFEKNLPTTQRTKVAEKVQQGLKDLKDGAFEEYDSDGLRGLARELTTGPVKARRTKTR